jgi:hypothetical protein
MPISTLKPRWHDLLIMVKTFMTCEVRYGLVFLYHLRLLMNFMGYPLNMPFYFRCSLYKMAMRFKCEKADSNLFHHGLIRLIVIHYLNLHGNNWQAFLSRNGFVDSESVQIDKSVVSETKVVLTGETVHPSTGRVEPVRGCLNNPSHLVWTTLTSLTAPLAALRYRKETKEKVI